jgi:flagellar basal-body rod modification protein FlgD
VSIGATEATTGSSALTGNGLSATTSTSTSKDKDMFMQLLVAQMKYQDPSKPADSTQFLTQSAQFSSLEKMETLANSMTQMLSGQMAFGASSLVGRNVSYTLADGTSGAGVVSGVQFSSDGPTLTVGETQVPISNVLSVTDAQTA